MHKPGENATGNPKKILEELAREQRSYHDAWEAQWSRRVNELARKSHEFDEDESKVPYRGSAHMGRR